MKIRTKRILAYILMITILMGNTMSASAMGADSGTVETISTEIVTEESVETVFETESADVIAETKTQTEEDSTEVVTEEVSSEEESVEEPSGEISTEEPERSTEEETTEGSTEETAENSTEAITETETLTTEEETLEETTETISQEETTVEETTTEEISTEETTVEGLDILGEIDEETTKNVTLYVSDAADGSYDVVDTYISLQEAFAAINERAKAEQFYCVELSSSEEDVVSSGEKTLAFPSKTAGLTIKADKELTEPEIFFKGNITLKSDVVFEDIIFVPSSKSTISLGSYSLTLSNCHVDDSRAVGFGAVSGSGVKKDSRLVLDDTKLTVFGAVNNVGSLVFAGENTESSNEEEQLADVSVLEAYGKINVGNVVLETDGILKGAASVTRKKGKITKVATQIAINGDVISDNGKTLYLDLLEKVSGEYIQLDLNKEEAQDIQKSGLYMAKAPLVSYPDIKALQRNEEESLVKTAGYLSYYAPAYGVILSFMDGEKETVISCRTFSDAVTEINNRKVKRDYVITLTEDCASASGVRQDVLSSAPKALTMPNKKYISSLIIQADPSLEEEKTAQLGFTGNITFTSDVTLRNVELVQMIKSGSTYVMADIAKDEHPVAVTLKTGGFDLTIEEEVTINTPIVLNGGNKGSLAFEAGSTFTTLTNDQEKPQADDVNVIYGSITGFGRVTVNGCDLTLSEYRTSRTGSYKASANKITNLELSDAALIITGDNTVASLTVKNLYLENANIYVSGKLAVTNATLEGTQKAELFADRDFTISGTLTSRSNNATLLTRLRGKGKAPYLTINGKVIRENGAKPIYVGVYNWDSASQAIRDDAVTLTNAPKVTAQLLTAKSALAVDFRPMAENYPAGSGEYHKDNTSGYMMMKSGKNIYVYEGSKVKTAVYVKHDEAEEGYGELFGFFPSIKEATAAVNAKKDRTAYYTYMMMAVNGSTSSPVVISMPSYAKQVTVTSLPDCDTDMKTITFSGKISLGADAVFKDIILAPVSKGKGTAFTIAAGSKNLTLESVKISDELAKAALKDITGNGKQTVILDSEGLEMAGSVTNAAALVVKESTQINGNVKSSVLRLENTQDGEAVTLTVKGAVNVTNVENTGAQQNILSYTRTSKNVTNLTVNGYISNESADKPVILRQDETDVSTLAYQSGIKMVLDNSAKMAVMPKASTDSFVIEAAVTDREMQKYTDETVLRLTKANKGVYLIDTQESTLSGLGIRLAAETDAGQTVTHCLDYTQTVNEINNRADRSADYTVSLVSDGTETGIDTNLTDSKMYSAFPLPKKNAKASFVLMSSEEAVCIPFTGSITGYGNVMLQDIVLQPVKSTISAAAINFNIAANADNTGTVFKLDGVTTKEQLLNEQTSRGYISNLAGTKNKTEVMLVNCGEMLLASGISNVKTLSLEGTKLLSAKNSTVTELIVDDVSAWISIGKLTLTNATVPEGVNSSYVGVKQDVKQNPQFTLNGNINGGRLQVRLYKATTSVSEGMALFDAEQEKEIDSYLNIPLMLAKKADPAAVRAYAYRVIDENGTVASNTDGVNKDTFASYKDGNYIKNGTQEAMFLTLGSDELKESAEAAKEELEQLAQEKILYALIYMADSYDVKEKACHESATVATLQSGHTVQILGMEVEWTYSAEWEEYIPVVWYYVQFYIGETLCKGYVEESFLAYSDELLLEWKNDWYMLFPFDNTMFAAETASYSDVEKFPTSYQVHLKKLKDSHPNWTFVPMNVGRDWDDCVDEQMGDYSWIYYNQPAEFRGAQINSTWYYASREGIEYYMDPRNFLTESNIFQFEQNTYNASYHTQSALQTFLNGTFMSGKVTGDSQGRTYAYVIWNSGKTRGLSPFNLAARVIQEQGVNGTSAMISGTYSGYEGYYNHYNIQASGTTDAEVIRNGLAYAKKMGWNTRVKSLDGGAAFIGNGYILKGQDTLYLQKFDIEHGSDSLHQYMQNIMAPYTEGRSMKSMYSDAGSLNSNFVFKIPVFDDMPGADYTLSPKSAKIEKGKTKQLTLKCDGVKISADKATYTSLNEYVATVSDTGLITAVHSGNAVITAKITEGDETIELTCKVEVYAPLKSISLSIEEKNLYAEDGLPDKVPVLADGVTKYLDKEDCPTQTTLTVTYNPEDTTDNKTVKWTVDNPDVVEVIQDTANVGKAIVIAKSGGKTNITATVGKHTSTVSVTVRVPMTEASLKLDEDNITLYKGEKTRVNVSYAPYETTDFIDPVWSSSNESVVKVVDGDFVAVGVGNATLYANVGPFIGSQSEVTGLSCKVVVKEYTVTFKDENGGTLFSTTGEYGSALEYLEKADAIPWNLAKEGYVFAGWYTEPDGEGFLIDEKNLLHGDMVLYPHFIDAASGFYAKPIGDIEYTGAYLKPEVEVYSGEKVLTYGVDYTIVYVNNKAVNDQSGAVLQPTAVIYGKGGYSGQQYKAHFDIVPKDISHTDVTAKNLLNAYTGKEQQMRPVLYDGGRILQRNIDYTLSYFENDNEIGSYSEAGTYAVEVNGTGNYSGSRIVYITISKRTLMSRVSVGAIADMKFNNGKKYASEDEITDCVPQNVKVTYSGKTLQEGTDYTIEHVNNRNIGTASVVVTGIGDYIGTKTVSYRITGTAMSTVTVKGMADMEYTGEGMQQDVSNLKIIDKNKTVLREGLDYTLSYQNNINSGRAVMSIIGINGYGGVLKKSFKINPYNIVTNSQTYPVEENGVTVQMPAFEVSMEDAVAEYDKSGNVKGIKGVKATFKGNLLKEGTDYMVTCKVDTATPDLLIVKVTGIGNFTGTTQSVLELTN